MRIDCRLVVVIGVLALSFGCAEEKSIRKIKAKTTLPIQYKQPDGWRRASVPGQLSLLTLFAKDDNIEISVSRFDGSGGGLLENVNRWLRQIGLPKLAPEQLKENVLPITVDGHSGSYVDLKGDSDRILGAIITKDNATWFFKLKGPLDDVDDQQVEAFRETFLPSVKFNGAYDG